MCSWRCLPLPEIAQPRLQRRHLELLVKVQVEELRLLALGLGKLPGEVLNL